MKKSLITIMAVVLFYGFAFSQDSLVVTAAPSIWARIVKVDGRERLEGPAINLITHIFKDFGVPVTVEIYPWKRAEILLKAGKIDAILTMLYSEDRTKFYIYTDSYHNVETCVVVKKGKAFPFKIWDDLIGKKGVIIRGRMKGTRWEAFRNEKLQIYEVNELSQVLKMLYSGRQDYGVEKKYSILMEAKNIGYLDKIEILPIPLSTDKAYIAFSKQSPFAKYVPKVNKEIAKLKDSGTLEKWEKDVLNIITEKK
ncbi:MAG: transporter substrate-binding domain-containing protein [Desulfobacteraceae bacterium]|nr:transporter substrate-binding domain-containing protein [Desulfobacteraceae bacterium]